MMFPQQQQHVQQQLLQLQQLIHQQRQQHHRHPHPPAQAGPNRAMQQQAQTFHPRHPLQQPRHQLQRQQKQMPQLNLHPSSQTSILNPNPMLQRTLIMQQMSGGLPGYSMPTPFFPPGSRASILGTPPVGIQLQTPRIRFGSHPFHPHLRGFNKDIKRMQDMRRDRYSPREPFRAKANNNKTTPGVKVTTGNKHVDTKKAAVSLSLKTQDSMKADEPEVKRRKLGSQNDDDVIEQSNSGEPTISKSTTNEETGKNEESAAGENLEPNAANAEVLSTMSSLKVTIQQSSESRAISTSAADSGSMANEDSGEELDSMPIKFICYICNVNCYNQKNFQKHMIGTRHHQRLLEIQQMSNACMSTLIPATSSVGRSRESDKKRPRWCSTCQGHFRGNIIEHRRTQTHKLSKYSLRPFCTVCSRHFKTPRKFVEHMKSPEHKQKVQEVKLQRSSLDKDQAGQDDPEDMITVDAVGCFDEDDEEGMTEGDDCDSDSLSDSDSQTLMSEYRKEPYDTETVYGQQYVVPVTGFLCKLCHKFYHSESTARFTHCKSLMHFQNFQGYKAQRAQDYLSVSYQEPAVSVVDSLGSTDDQIPASGNQAEEDLKSANITGNDPEMEVASCEAETATPTDDDIIPNAANGNNIDSCSPLQKLQPENPDGSDQGDTVIGNMSDVKFDSNLIDIPCTKNEMLCGKVEGEQEPGSDKCESSCEAETATPSDDGTIPNAADRNNIDSCSPLQNLQAENLDGGDQGDTVIGNMPDVKFDCNLTDSPCTKNEMPSGKVEGKQEPGSDKCESSSIVGSEVADEEQDGNEECDLGSSKTEEPSETEDGEDEHLTDSCLAEKEGEKTNVKGEENELGEEDRPVERKIPRTRSGRAVRGRRPALRRKK
ncbi:cip1-interacting zinc finger protein-like [Leucoraja erinacea]|uniref:cip1-interacting zinc finger protein-like n=1 Tax=Leucoraja erinaceus TaxID=7782 RepID=UPI0024582EE0|nr:cip1-interacting zinc finger protein-like [Leucoraja erinacea]